MLYGSKQQEAIQEVINKNRPDYASLFGSVELCDCQHCRSIYSPAAYLVELLQFLGLGFGPDSPMVTPLDVLIGNDGKKIIGRRPDIAHIQLSCENTNTTLPYVDLVNEVLESYIAFDQTLPLQKPTRPAQCWFHRSRSRTKAPRRDRAELAANPENTHDLAYEALAEAVYPFTLPFNQPIAALRLTLEQMGTSRHEVMGAFRSKHSEAADGALDVEALKLTGHEFAILTGEQFDGTPPIWPELDWDVSDFYGLKTAIMPVDTAWVAGDLPAGAQQHLENDTWTFAAFAPPPPSGITPHASKVAAGVHQHFFDKVTDAGKLKVEDEDRLFAEIFLDPANLPQQVMLQWNDGTWEHRAYWGLSKINWVGVESTTSRRYMGPLPPAGSWERLEVPAYFVGAAGRLSGMAFTLFGGGAAWGAAGKRSSSWVEWLTHVPTFLAKTGVTYVELVDLVRTGYINPALPQGEALATFERIPISYSALSRLVANGFADVDAQALDKAEMTLDELKAWAGEHFEAFGKLLVLDAPDSACDLTLTRLQHLDGTMLDEADLSRLHRFIRLWRKLGWTMQDLDRAMVALQATDITPNFLRQLGQIVQLQVPLNLPIQKLLSFWGAIPATGDDALYGKLFLNKAVREIDPVFAPVKGEYLKPADLKIKDHVPALLAGLRTRAADLVLIRKDAGLAGDDAPLTLATATTLYRYVTLARALKMAVKDLIDLLALSGERPFSKMLQPPVGFNDIDPARTLRFVRLAGRVEQSGFTPASLSYLFNSLEDAPRNLAPGDEPIRLLMASLSHGLIRIAAENVPTVDPTGEVTRAKLAMLFEAHVVEQIAGLVAGTQIYSAPLATLPAGLALPAGKVTYDDKSRLLRAAGWLTDAEKDVLLALSAVDDYAKAVTSLYQQPLT